MHSGSAKLIIETGDDKYIFHFSGLLRVGNLDQIETVLNAQEECLVQKEIILDFVEVDELDSAAVLLILSTMKKMQLQGCESTLSFDNEEFEQLFKMVEKHAHLDTSFTCIVPSFVEKIGKKASDRVKGLLQFLAFFGQLSMAMLLYLRSFRAIRWKEIVFEMNESGIKALGIISLTMFLVGIVIAYQSSVQLKIYGANIFIVDMLGISILRELAPMLTAIVVAGRSGSAYAAQIGVMKITEELDAMRTMGFDPYAFLVLPRVLALMLMMPILIFFADIMGVVGGMLIAHIELGLSPTLFLERFSNVIDIRHFWVGIVKGPFFAILIASIGVFRGLMVKNDTQSIGFNTTKSVVESIFIVIICDAIFSIFFTHMGI